MVTSTQPSSTDGSTKMSAFRLVPKTLTSFRTHCGDIPRSPPNQCEQAGIGCTNQPHLRHWTESLGSIEQIRQALAQSATPNEQNGHWPRLVRGPASPSHAPEAHTGSDDQLFRSDALIDECAVDKRRRDNDRVGFLIPGDVGDDTRMGLGPCAPYFTASSCSRSCCVTVCPEPVCRTDGTSRQRARRMLARDDRVHPLKTLACTQQPRDRVVKTHGSRRVCL